MLPRPFCLLVLSGLVLAPASAFAQDYSLDIELVHPSFSPGSLPGIEAPDAGKTGTIRFGGLMQFESNPLVVVTQDGSATSVVADRLAMDLGISYDFSKHVALRLVLPTAASFGSTSTDLNGNGVGLGDIRAGTRIWIADPGPVSLGLHLDFAIPTGTKNAYLGEGTVRFDSGFMADIDLGRLDILADVGINARPAVATQEDLTAGSELDTRLALRGELVENKLWAHAGIAGIGAFNNLYQGGGGNSLELLGGVQLQPTKKVLLDLGLGKGLADGYGSTDFRAVLGLTWIAAPAEPIVEPVAEVKVTPRTEIKDDDLLVEAPTPEEPKVQWKEGELARVEEKEIVIRDQIQFEEGTAVILPASLPLLKEVARLMNENGQIGFMVIEGHASNEGSFEYNYDLSNLRARSVWQGLIEAGVHPDRIGYRGLGEVEPVDNADSEEARVRNRRVVFAIVRMYQPGDTIPELPNTILLPWNGETRTIPTPTLPERYTNPQPATPPPPPPPPKSEVNKGVPDANIFRNEDEDEDMPAPQPPDDAKKESGGDK